MANMGDRLGARFMMHNLSLLRFEAGQRRKIVGLLRTLESQLIAALYAHDPTGWPARRFSKRAWKPCSCR
jgi:hypothetical protein